MDLTGDRLALVELLKSVEGLRVYDLSWPDKIDPPALVVVPGPSGWLAQGDSAVFGEMLSTLRINIVGSNIKHDRALENLESTLATVLETLYKDNQWGIVSVDSPVTIDFNGPQYLGTYITINRPVGLEKE